MKILWSLAVQSIGASFVFGIRPEIPIPGFLVLNAKRHVNSFAELTLEERQEIGDILARAELALKRLGITKGNHASTRRAFGAFSYLDFPNAAMDDSKIWYRHLDFAGSSSLC